MPSVLSVFAGKRAGNYCTNPTKDVEVVYEPHHCAGCGEEVFYNRSAGSVGNWEHTVEQPEPRHYCMPRPHCQFCGTDERGSVEYKAYAWYDATECSRCGGVTGYALGD